MSDELRRAVEFGGYLADAAQDFITLTGDEDCDTQTDAFRRLSSAIYEFRKRATKCKREHVEAPSAPPASAGGEVIEANIATVAAYECGLEDGQRKERARVERELSRLERLLAARAAKG